ncbi:MAG TPA: hypothetical protein DCR55_08845 [Lentisphaeria bacterium]|nr:hypothetical protein [Lentisphaeria bacterium]
MVEQLLSRRLSGESTLPVSEQLHFSAVFFDLHEHGGWDLDSFDCNPLQSLATGVIERFVVLAEKEHQLGEAIVPMCEHGDVVSKHIRPLRVVLDRKLYHVTLVGFVRCARAILQFRPPRRLQLLLCLCEELGVCRLLGFVAAGVEETWEKVTAGVVSHWRVLCLGRNGVQYLLVF